MAHVTGVPASRPSKALADVPVNVLAHLPGDAPVAPPAAVPAAPAARLPSHVGHRCARACACARALAGPGLLARGATDVPVPAPGSAAGTALAVISGAVVGLGVTMLLVGARRTRGTRARSQDTQDDGGPGGEPGTRTGVTASLPAVLQRIRREGTGGPVPRRIAGAVAAFVVVAVLTRWPAAAFLAATGTWSLPRLWQPDAAARAGTERLEAIAVWTEMLRDTLSAAAGLEQAILSTAGAAPDALAGPVAALTGALHEGQSLPVALQQFADDVDDPTMDLVVAALLLAATRQARDLTGLLSTLAQAARDQVVLRLRVAAGRARVRTSVRIILVTTLGMIAGLVLLNRGYLSVYDSAEGQLVLLVVGGLFAASFVWLGRIAAVPTSPRLLTAAAPSSPQAAAHTSPTASRQIAPQIAPQTSPRTSAPGRRSFPGMTS